MGRVAGKVAIVTGAASGLGRASAAMLAREGAEIVATDINLAGAQATAAAIGGRTLALHHDVTSEDAWKAVIARAMDVFGRVDVLVNSAGIAINATVQETSLEDWRRVHAIDLDGVFLGCKHVIEAMAGGGGGSIVNISSISGIIAGHNTAAYSSAKAGVRLLSKSVALHCARKGYNIRCNSVHPVFVDTPILQGVIDKVGDKAQALAKLARQIPLGKVGEPDDIAYAVLYLASDESKLMTGAEMVLDGGISAM
jgi:NAD(P)-dependent dehydrogenase (short-subunit alcohol dehydrogenase family)